MPGARPATPAASVTGWVKQGSSLRRWLLLAAVLLLVAFVLPPLINLNRYQRKIADSIGRSIGRPVRISSVHLRLLPLPGLAFSDFSVEEDPRFGVEPTLHSSSVVANLRLLSLWRGRLEVSRIHFDDASLNLVREPEGGWNVASVLVQAAQIPNAPTGQRYAGSAPRFPYIEAENTRINFKQANEKKPFSFLNSELSISLAPGNEWEVHFQAQPVRTDLNLALSDTGLLRIDGTLGRAGLMREMPLNLKLDWTGLPLGQLSRLTLGRDIGWRGGVEVQAQIAGTAQLARIQSKINVAGFHRAEFTPNHPLDLATTCQALFRKQTRTLEDMTCKSPVGEGALLLTGSIQDAPELPQADLKLEVSHVPASAALAALQEVRNGLGAGVQASGTIDGEFQYTSQLQRSPFIAGQAEVAALGLSSSASGKPFLLAPVRLRWESPSSGNAGLAGLLLQPARVSMGGPAPVTVNGRFTSAGFDLHASGAASLARLQQFNQGFGLLGGSLAALGPSQGAATADLDFRGPWLLPEPDPDHPVNASTAEGSISLHNAEVRTSYLSRPLHIASAQAILSPTQVTWTNATISYGTMEGQATLEYPTSCAVKTGCPRHFSLVTPALDLGVLRSTMLGAGRGQLLHQLLNRIDRSSTPWPLLSGTVQAEQLAIGKLTIHDATGTLDIGGETLTVRSLNGRAGNGTLHLSGLMNSAGSEPAYQVELEVTNASPAALGSIFEERWGTGTISLAAQLRMAGLDAEDLAGSAAGTVHWSWTKGALQAETPRIQFDQWNADATIAGSTITITHSLLIQGNEARPLSGTISFDRELDLKAGLRAGTQAITGTLEHPQVQTESDQ
jgi:hypothetical protein